MSSRLVPRSEVKRRPIIIAPDARDDLNSLYDWIAGAASPSAGMPRDGSAAIAS
jgi:hypothetical protein